MPYTPPSSGSGAIQPPNAPASSVGLLAQNYDLLNTNGGTGMGTAGDLMMAQVPWFLTQSVTNICLYISTAGVTLTSGQCFATIYDSSGNLLATSVNQSTAWSSGTGVISSAISGGPISIPAGTGANPCVYVGYYWNGTTQPFVLKGLGAIAIANGASSAANLRWGRGATGQTTAPPSMITMSSRTATGATFWAGLS